MALQLVQMPANVCKYLHHLHHLHHLPSPAVTCKHLQLAKTLGKDAIWRYCPGFAGVKVKVKPGRPHHFSTSRAFLSRSLADTAGAPEATSPTLTSITARTWRSTSACEVHVGDFWQRRASRGFWVGLGVGVIQEAQWVIMSLNWQANTPLPWNVTMSWDCTKVDDQPIHSTTVCPF
ncbi:hypothetical protein K504DRAFT_532093 [Pleomassaria siparia CBS 279.74]|uniref:Uncharacterized protein n=1 Tax=Pleomassaria siparia CBS 279.74 TaxID=1314801 RepID=A0A6G1KGA9_9PLEO|nr:hypothetical protein K504DRAFT_532093 [Pleomassaria siparia CBS 279.74]